jgi:hypothetical protein
MIYLLTAIGLLPGGSTHLHTNNTQNNTNNKYCGRVRAVPRICEFYPDICLSTEEKARKHLSQGKKHLSQFNKNVSQCTVYILPKHPHKHTHCKTHTTTHPRAHTHTLITKQCKTTTVQIKTNRVQYVSKWNSHIIIKCTQYKRHPNVIMRWTFRVGYNEYRNGRGGGRFALKRILGNDLNMCFLRFIASQIKISLLYAHKWVLYEEVL